MFKPEINVVKFDLVDVITTSVTQPACPTNTELPCLGD